MIPWRRMPQVKYAPPYHPRGLKGVEDLSLGRTQIFFALAFAAATISTAALGIGMSGSGSVLFEDSFKDTSLIESMEGVSVADGAVTVAPTPIFGIDPIRDPTLTLSLAQTGYPQIIGAPSVVRAGDTWYMYFHATPDNNYYAIYVATSTDGVSWSPRDTAAVTPAGSAYRAAYPGALYHDGSFRMWYGSYDGVSYTIYYATSSDGITWSAGSQVLGTDYDGGINYWSADPSVLWDGSQYAMWYWSTYPGATSSIRYATSSDGVSWDRKGIVMTAEPLGGETISAVIAPTVVSEGTDFVMWYGCQSATGGNICRAKSADGIAWDQEGVVLRPSTSDPTWNVFVTLPNAVLQDDGSYRVYYEVRGTQSPSPYSSPGDQIWSGTTASGGSIVGYRYVGTITSVGIAAGPGNRYRFFEASWDVPEGTQITFDILDAHGVPIPGFEGITTNEYSLLKIDGRAFPEIHLRANFVGTADATPSLYAWEVH